MSDTKEITMDTTDDLIAEYKRGFIDGLCAYAHWKDGVEYVGTCNTTLKEVIQKVEDVWCFNSPTRKSISKSET